MISESESPKMSKVTPKIAKIDLSKYNLSTGSENENRTAFYIESIERAFDSIYGKSVIGFDEYSSLVTELPCDLACKLRLVPDENLSARLSHLHEVFLACYSDYNFMFSDNVSIVSVENSNKMIPFDCDLVVMCNNTEELHLIDFTSSKDNAIIENKRAIMENNIKLSKMPKTLCHVRSFESFRVSVNINFGFVSKEPGTMGLRIIDSLCKLPAKQHDAVMKSMYAAYVNTNNALSETEMTNAPGDYKEMEIPNELADRCESLVKKQSDLNSVRLLVDGYNLNSSYFPYVETLAKIARNSHKLKKLIPIEAAKVFDTRDLQSNLAELSSYWLCKALHAATLTENIVAIDDSDNLTFLSEFPCDKKDKFLPNLLVYKACVQMKKGHVFKIIFNPLHMDEKLRRLLCHDTPKKEKHAYTNSKLTDSELSELFIRNATEDYVEDFTNFTSLSLDQPKDNIWRKIATISALASNDLENMGRSTCALLDNTIEFMEKMYLGGCLAHYYEVNKAILASLKVSPGDNEYYVGVNGAYSSLTIVKMCSTLDSFSKTNFSVVYKPERSYNKRRTRLSGKYVDDVFITDFYSTDPNILSYNLRLPMVITSLATWELENNMEGGAITEGMTPKILFDSALHSLVNRDQFAQAAEQVRYFYMSAIGYGGSAADIAEKVDFITVRHAWEALYIMRSFKIGFCLSALSSSRRLSNIENKSTKELEVAFPHSSFPSKSFSQTISSMYLCNVYNKFRAFHEVSDAVCYMAIVDELDIYKSRVGEDHESVSGVSSKLLTSFLISDTAMYDYITSQDFINDEVDFNLSLAKVKSKRYCGSLSYIIGATLFHADVNQGVIDNIYAKLNLCPIEACTMKGAMDVGNATEKNQGLRSASSILENMIRTYDMDPKSVNKSVLSAASLFDKMRVDDKSMSIYQCVLRQLCAEHSPYRYRIVDKDQKGHREISVLNFEFRVGALMVETISRELSFAVSDTEVVHNPAKDKIVEDAIKNSFEADSELKGTYCYDNSDQKRWGPNHNVNFFCYMMFAMLRRDPGLCRIVCLVFDKIFDKRAKFPEPLIDLIMRKNVRSSNSKIISKFIDSFAPKMDNQIFETVMPMGMCQGILHDTSSVFHAIKAKATINLVNMVNPSCNVKYFTTSDDAEGIIRIPDGQDKVNAVKIVHVAGLKIGNLFNIVRSNPKSAFNFHIAELNSIFYKRGVMATPSLKQRIAKIDVGFGTNHIEDYLTVLSAASNYLANGGSYMGAYICSILNITLHTEQWLRWSFAKSDSYYRPVEMGGFPVIEPISTIISGGVSNLYLRSCKILSPENYSRVIVSTLLCPPERLSLADFSRSGSDSAKKTFADDNLTVYKGTGPFGLFQTVRTDRKLSVFERRHGVSKWIIPDSFANLNRHSPSASDFLFTIFRNTSVNTLDTNLGVNSFFVRMAEPWVSYNRKCFIVSGNSPFAATMGGEGARLSHSDLNNIFLKRDSAAAAFELELAYRRTSRQPEYEILESQLTVRLSDARSLFDYLSTQEAESFRRSIISPSIQTITLRGQSATDSDVYFTSVVKAVAGKSSRQLINNYRRHANAYDEIDIMEPASPATLIEAIVFADNAVSIYEKFIRRDTKMLIPNRVDDMKALCIDILKNKFTERMGINVVGSLDMNPERTRPYAYTNWYQNLIEASAKREEMLTRRALAGVPIVDYKVGIKASQGLITQRDMFEIASGDSPKKTVLFSVKSRNAFSSAIKTWLGANVSITMDRQTIQALLNNRLTTSHDYFRSNGTYLRIAKQRYLEVSCRSVKAMHIITTTVVTSNRRRETRFLHTFLFPENVDNSKVSVQVNPEYANESWVNSLANSIRNIKRISSDFEYTSGNKRAEYKPSGTHRKTLRESDRFLFTCITPGQELEITTYEKSLTICLTKAKLELPVSYLMPTMINEMDGQFKLTDFDLKAATRVYSELKTRTHNFDVKTIEKDSTDAQYIDFILVNSSCDTPDFVIDDISDRARLNPLTGNQIDILKTMLVNTKSIGVNYSAHRFSSYLLNMGKRRKHNFTHFTRRILGARAEVNSEDSDNESITEELVTAGSSQTNYVFVDEESDEIKTINVDGTVLDVSNITQEIPRFSEQFIADQDQYSGSEQAHDTDLVVTSIDDSDLFEPEDYDSELSDSETVKAEPAAERLISASTENVTTPSASPTTAEFAASSLISDIFGEMMAGTSFDEVFNIEQDDEDDGLSVDKGILDSMDSIFKKSLESTYGKMVDVKDQKMKSVVTGHTVNQNIESARPLMEYLSSWLKTAGMIKDFPILDEKDRNISMITSLYIMMNDFGTLEMTNPLQKAFGSSEVILPAELSALAIINNMYCN